MPFFLRDCNFGPLIYVILGVRDEETFNHMVLRHRGLLFAVCRRYGRRGLDEDDLLQEVLMALWQRREQLLSISVAPKQAAWMWRVARSTCIDILRGTPPSYPLPEGYDTPEEDTTPRRDLHEMIAQLDEPDRTIVAMQLEGYSYEEIGDELGLTEKNVSVRLVRTKERLRQLMGVRTRK